MSNQRVTLPDLTHDFAADFAFAAFVIGKNALRRRNDRHSAVEGERKDGKLSALSVIPDERSDDLLVMLAE